MGVTAKSYYAWQKRPDVQSAIRQMQVLTADDGNARLKTIEEMLVDEQVSSLQTLIAMRDDPRVDTKLRKEIAESILDRGGNAAIKKVESKVAHAVLTREDIEEMKQIALAKRQEQIEDDSDEDVPGVIYDSRKQKKSVPEGE